MSFSEYLLHYIAFPEILLYFALAMGLLLVLILIIFLFSKIGSSGHDDPQKREKQLLRAHALKERLYEMIFSGTSILFFITTYYLIERFMPAGPILTFWDSYKDYLLLALIVISCLLNNALDHYLIRLDYLSREDCAAGRVTGMLYMLIIFFYIKFIYNDANYDHFITYFLGLVVGRFVYFDATFSDFIGNMKQAVKNLPLMCMVLGYLGAMCLYGFSTDYLIKHIGVITNVFITHLFMCVAVFILSRFHLFERR